MIVALSTSPGDKEHLKNFYRKVRPGGWWGEIAKSCPEVQDTPKASDYWLGRFLGVIFIYSSLLGFGYLIIGQNLLGLGLFVVSIVGGLLTLAMARKTFTD